MSIAADGAIDGSLNNQELDKLVSIWESACMRQHINNCCGSKSSFLWEPLN